MIFRGIEDVEEKDCEGSAVDSFSILTRINGRHDPLNDPLNDPPLTKKEPLINIKDENAVIRQVIQNVGFHSLLLDKV